jgi:hypothetical protein
MDGLLIPLDGLPGGLLRTPTQRMEQSTNMVHVITDTETLRDQKRDARAGPQVVGESGRLRPAQQRAFQSAGQGWGQFWGTPAGGPRRDRRAPFLSVGRFPSPHAAPIHTDHPRYFHGGDDLEPTIRRLANAAAQVPLEFRLGA